MHSDMAPLFRTRKRMTTQNQYKPLFPRRVSEIIFLCVKGVVHDFIFVVDDTFKWHEENLKLNRKDYSGLSRMFGSHFIYQLEKFLFPIHFNPFVKHGEHLLKYGVISKRKAIADLSYWTLLTFAGRLHKPVPRTSILCWLIPFSPFVGVGDDVHQRRRGDSRTAAA